MPIYNKYNAYSFKDVYSIISFISGVVFREGRIWYHS